MRLPAPLRTANETLAFFLEIVAIVAFARWGWHASGNTALRLFLAVAVPGVAATVWGMYASPKARYTLPAAGVVGVKVLVFVCAVAALYDVGGSGPALSYAAVVAANTVLLTLDRRARARAPLAG
ncbi:YrdB family protein [Streptomyces sp. NBC_00102]|uniref:YrdB family protein n=1 Tax=Streptomyces sp. NBC_00102 TaxID=2975652 RepID=UPI002259A74F|nr:YrdB family protein [Streptomyces sp. NBC_00102]MCX5396627.1 YrdB family protein [Streptomyces sp. NBC_00102]